MPTTPPSTNSVLPQALTELSKLAPTSEAAKQGIEVIVKQLSGNLLNLTRTTGLLSKPALLPNPEIKGDLNNGQNLSVKINTTNGPVLEFFSSVSTVDQKLIELTKQQLEILLKLPAKQLAAQLSTTNTAATKGIILNATILAMDPNLQKTDTVSLGQQIKKTQLTTQLQNTNILLKLQLTDSKSMAEIELPVKQLQPFSVGDKVALMVTPKGVNWQVNIQTATTNQVTQLNVPIEQSQSLPAKQLLQSTSHNSAVNSQTVFVSPNQAINLTKSVIQSLVTNNETTHAQIDLPIKQVLQHLHKTHTVQAQALSQTLQTLPIDKLSLQLDPQDKFQLKVETNKPVALIPITREIAHALAPLKLPNQQNLVKLVNQLPPTELTSSPNNQQVATDTQGKESNTKPLAQILSQLGDSAKKVWFGKQEQTIENTKLGLSQNVNSITSKDSPVHLQSQSIQESAISLKNLINQLQQQVNSSPIDTSLITPKLLTDKQQQAGLIQQLLRVVQAKAELPSTALKNIENALTDADFNKQAPEQTTKQVIEQVLQQTKSALPQGKELDSSNIKQLLTSPALNLTPVQLVSPTTNQGFLNGLITVLQMSLSARLTRHQTSREEHVAKVLSSILPNTGQSKPSVTKKALNEFLQLEQKHQLIREIGRLFSGHQASKLHNAEQLLQGQETFYYNLPSLMNGTFQDIELLIKREDNHKEQHDDGKNSNKTWQLTMKLAIGELGELLTKAKLRPNNLEVNFYASNEDVKIQVMNYLPLLKRRLISLGIEVSKSQCQLGKIPESLQDRPYHVFQTKV